MRKALDKCKMSEFLHSSQGLDTVLTENAGNLSGGQRQRLALARALLHDSPVYIFDEATSSVDADSEREIVALMYELAETKCVIMISHRLAKMKGAARIYVSNQDRCQYRCHYTFSFYHLRLLIISW